MGLPGQKIIDFAQDTAKDKVASKADGDCEGGMRGSSRQAEEERDSALWIGAGGVRVLPVRSEGRKDDAAVRGSSRWGLVDKIHLPRSVGRPGLVDCVLEEGVPGLAPARRVYVCVRACVPGLAPTHHPLRGRRRRRRGISSFSIGTGIATGMIGIGLL